MKGATTDLERKDNKISRYARLTVANKSRRAWANSRVFILIFIKKSNPDSTN